MNAGLRPAVGVIGLGASAAWLGDDRDPFAIGTERDRPDDCILLQKDGLDALARHVQKKELGAVG